LVSLASNVLRPCRPILLLLLANRQAPLAADLEVRRSKKEWKEQLSPEAYHVLIERGTERAFTSSLNDEERTGVFSCGGCGSPLFASAAKVESPYQPLRFLTPHVPSSSTTAGQDGRHSRAHCPMPST